MTDSSQAADAAAHSITHEVKLLVELMRLCRVMLLYGDPGAQRDHLLRAEVVTLLQAVRPSGPTELVILFDAWGAPPLAALHAHIRTALAQITTEPIPDSERDQPLSDVLRSGQEACNVTFLIIFDRFNEYLLTPSGNDGMREFEEEFIQAAIDATLRANFLLVLDQDAEPLLERLRDRIPFLRNDSVRLPSVKLPAEQPLQLSQTDAVSVAASEVEQQAGDAPPISGAPFETQIQRAEFSNKASLHSRKGRSIPALVTVVLICAVAGAGVWFAQRAPQPVAPLTEQRATASGSIQKNASEHPAPGKAPAVENPTRERMKVDKPEQSPTMRKATKEKSASAAKAMAQKKPKAAPPKPRDTAVRPSNANAGPIKENPKSAPTPPQVAPASSVSPPKLAVSPAAPARAAATVAAVQPQRTIDQVYEQRAGEECARGLVGALCREKIRYQLCADKWTRDEQPGITRCYVW